MGRQLKENFAAVEEAVRFRQAYRAVVSNHSQPIKKRRFLITWIPRVLSMFDFKMKAGDPRTALPRPNTIQ